MSWSFVLSDLNGTQLGELTAADERKVSLPHMRVPTATFKVPLWHPLASNLVNGDCLLRCYRYDPVSNTNSLAFNGPVVSVEESGDADSQSLACSAAGPFWRLGKRLIGTTAAGISWGQPSGNVDLGQIAYNILSTVNGVSFTGIAQGSATASINGGVGPWWFKKASEAIAELATGLNSFEFVVRPTDPTTPTSGGDGVSWPTIGYLDVAPTIGANRPNVIFEYGTTRANVQSYTRTLDRTDMITAGYISVQGWPDAPVDGAAPINHGSDRIGVHGYFVDLVDDAGVSNDTLRGNILDYHLAIRKNPKQTIIFKPANNSTFRPFIDYATGDTIRARAVVQDTVRFDGSFRIWGATFSIDKNGNEDTELELVMP